VAVALHLSACSGVFEASVPRRDGVLSISGLSAPVTIVRDLFGVPHITAGNDRDLYFAQGFVHAQDRLFQMDFERRLARGELAELLGKNALPADRLFRHLGFAARAPAIVASWPPKTREIVASYCAGVNAAMDALRAWPAEFRILRAAPRRFLPEDVAAVGLLKSLGLSQWIEEAALYRAWHALPREKALELLPALDTSVPGPAAGRAPRPRTKAASRDSAAAEGPERAVAASATRAPHSRTKGAPWDYAATGSNEKAAAAALRRAPHSRTKGAPWDYAATGSNEKAAAAAVRRALDLAALADGLAFLRATAGGLPRAGGSNAWAVSGKKSATGRPLLANDPHMLLTCPSLWYENHLVAPGVDVYGVSFPGAPCVVIGHNRSIAWGFTNAMLDDADFFLEDVDGETVMFRKKRVPVTRRVETIRVRGGREETVTVRETPHGPILTPVFPGVGEALSLRWVGFDGGDPVGALHAVNRAENREEFLAAAALFPHPAQNVVYADVAGNIGIVMVGKIPLRRGGSGQLPVPGDTGEWEWTGTLPFSSNPKVWNPAEGFVVAANVPFAPVTRGPYHSRLYEPPDRARRIARLLSGPGPFSVDKFEWLQADVCRPEAEKTVSLAIRSARRREATAPDLREAARILSEWDLCVSAESPGAALYEAFSEKLVENTFRDDMGPALFEEVSRTSRILWNAMDRALARGDSLFFGNAATGRKETLDELMARSLADAMSLLKHRLGGAYSTWSWGRLHQVTFEHPFGKKRYLRRWFNIGPTAVPGDGRTVFKEEFRHGTDFSVVVGPSMRQVVPLGFRRMARSVIATGASGHFFEPHYGDQAALWLSGRSHPAWTDVRDIEANAEYRLKLTPKPR
jgi:penicillin amidase